MADPHDIARAMVALPGWRWLPGMGTEWRCEITGPDDVEWVKWRCHMGRGGVKIGPFAGGEPEHNGVVLPDLTDFATLGCVEHGLLAPAGVWIWRSSTVLIAGKPAVMACEGTAKVRGLGQPRGSLPAALLDGLRAVTS